MHHFLVHHVLCKTVEDCGTLECACLFVWEDCWFNLCFCRLTLHMFLSLKELKSHSGMPTTTSWLVDQNLQSGLRWFSFSPCFVFFSYQYSNHVNIFYHFFWASLFHTHCSYFSLEELWRLFSLVILVSQFQNAQNTPKFFLNHRMIVDLWIGYEYYWCIHQHQAWDHWSSLYLGGYCGEWLTIPWFHVHYQTREPWVLELISTKSKLLGISSK